MTTELRSLDAAELTRLGGLKTRCSAALFCAEHTNPHPCEECMLDGKVAVGCSACHQEFPGGLPEPGERPCASQAVFAASGRVAFEADALAALAGEARTREGARERRKREKEEAERARESQALKEREERARRAREEAERARDEAERERRESALERAAAEARSAGETAKGDSRARLSAWVALVAALAGAYMVWRNPLVDLPRASTGILVAYTITVLLVWAGGVASLAGKEAAHATLRWWAPIVWAFAAFAWPGVSGLIVAYVAGVSGLGAFTYMGYITLAAGLVAAAVTCVSYTGVVLTMRPPWPSGLMNNDFKSLRSGRAWLALLATVVLNFLAWDGSARLLERAPGFERPTAINPRKPLLEPVANKPAPDKDLRGFVRATLAEIATFVNEHPKLSTPAVPGALPRVDAAVAALARLARPAAGNRAKAKALAIQATQMMSRNAEWADVAAVLAQAHATDPQDAQILVDLTHAQLQSGRHAQALESVLEALRLAPTSANAWIRLAQVRLATSKGDTRLVQEAARYYVVGYWFSRDRPRTLRLYNGDLKAGPGDSPDNPAAIGIALQRLPK